MLTAKLKREPKINKYTDIRRGRKVKTYRIVIYPIVEDEDGNIVKDCGRLRSGPFFKELDARNNLNKFISTKLEEIEKSINPKTREKRCNELLDDFLHWGRYEKQRKWKESTYLTYEDSINSQIRPYLNNCKISELIKKTENFQEHLSKGTYIKQGRTYSLSSSRKRLAYTIYRYFLEYLHDKKIIKVNMVAYLGKVEFKRAQPRETILEHDEIGRFIEIAKERVKDPNIWLMIEFLLTTGLRKGEMTALFVRDINFKLRDVNVYKTYDSRCKEKYRETKTEAGKRHVPFPEFLVEPLQEMLDERRKTFTDTELLDQPLFIKNGNPYPTTTLSHAFELVQKQFELETGKHVVIHDLRRTFSSLLCENSEGNHDYIKKIMGHSSFSTTAEIYAVCNANQAKKYTEKMNQSLNDTFEKINVDRREEV